MIILTTYLIVGFMFAMFVFIACTVANKWEGIREVFEEKYPGFNFHIIAAGVYVIYIVSWPIWLIWYCKNIV